MEQALVFPATHHMLKGEFLLKRAGFRLRLVPAPPEAGQVCSTAIALKEEDLSEARSLLEREGVELSGVFSYLNWWEGRIRGALFDLLETARPHPGLAEVLFKLAEGRRLDRNDIAALLSAKQGSWEVLSEAARRVTRCLRDNRVTPLVAVVMERITEERLESLILEMRDQKMVYLLLILDGGSFLPHFPHDLGKSLGEEMVTIASVRDFKGDIGNLFETYHLRQLLIRRSAPLEMNEEDLMDEIIFLRDNPAGPLASGNLLPLCDDELWHSEEMTKSRLRTLVSVLRLVLVEAYIPVPSLLWREGLPAGADMPVLEVRNESLADVAREAEEILGRQGFEFARSKRWA